MTVKTQAQQQELLDIFEFLYDEQREQLLDFAHELFMAIRWVEVLPAGARSPQPEPEPTAADTPDLGA
jgi:hypothetical protein